MLTHRTGVKTAESDVSQSLHTVLQTAQVKLFSSSKILHTQQKKLHQRKGPGTERTLEKSRFFFQNRRVKQITESFRGRQSHRLNLQESRHSVRSTPNSHPLPVGLHCSGGGELTTQLTRCVCVCGRGHTFPVAPNTPRHVQHILYVHVSLTTATVHCLHPHSCFFVLFYS